MTTANAFSGKKASSQWKLTIEGLETMSSARSEELRLISEQAFESLDQSTATPDEREAQLNWLMESALHVREVLAATQWNEELRLLLDPDHRIDADALIEKALSSSRVSLADARSTDSLSSDAQEGRVHPTEEEIEILDLGDATERTRALGLRPFLS